MAWILQVRIANKFLNKYLHVSPQALKQAFKWLFPSQIELYFFERAGLGHSTVEGKQEKKE